MKIKYLLYLVLVVVWVLFSYLFVDPNIGVYKILFTGIFLSEKFLVSSFYLILILLSFIFYIKFLGSKNIDVGDIKKIIIISFLLIFSYPAILSFDIFNYILTAKLTFLYFENPYVVMPIEIINEPMLAFTHAANRVALYGPVWILLTGIPFSLGLNNLLFSILTFKLFVVFFYLLSSFLIYKITKSNLSLALFALNPLVIIETFISGHNDIVMMGLSIISIYFATKGRFIMAAILLFLSILIKFATIFLVPLFLFIVINKALKKDITLERVGLIGFISMFVIFLLSALRVEIYPWYAIWFLPFASFAIKNKFIYILSISLSFSLLLRYIPYMYLGDHFGITPILKIILTLVPPAVSLIFYKKFILKDAWKNAIRIKR